MALSLQRRARTSPSRSATMRLSGSPAIVDCRPVSTCEAHSYSSDPLSTDPVNAGSTSSGETPYCWLRRHEARRRGAVARAASSGSGSGSSEVAVPSR